MERISEELLPDGITYDWPDLTCQQNLAGNTMCVVFPLCVMLVLRAPAAQYESWTCRWRYCRSC